MTTSRIQMTNEYGKTPSNVFKDFDWIHLHKQELLDQFGEVFVIVFNEKVIGVGNTYDAALADAEQHLPSEGPVITPVQFELRHKHPFLRVRPKPE